MTHTIYPGLEGLAATATDAELAQMHESQREAIKKQRKAFLRAQWDCDALGHTITLEPTADGKLKLASVSKPRRAGYVLYCPHCDFTSVHRTAMQRHMDAEQREPRLPPLTGKLLA